MQRIGTVAVVVAALNSAAAAPTPSDEDLARTMSTPAEVRDRGADAAVWDDHAIDFSMNPFYLRGDFDGDRRTDFAVAVTRTSDGARRVVVLRGKGKVVWLDRIEGKLEFPTPGAWVVHDRNTKVGRSPFEAGRPPELRGDAMVLIKPEASASMVYWNGKRFVSYWVSD